METRDVEILRLGQLYQGGQNNEKLSMQYNQDMNSKIVAKLNSQIDFVNKENHRMQTQLDLFVKDKSVIDHIDRYRQNIDDLTFENQTLRKDLRELTTTLKDYQEAEFKRAKLDRNRVEEQDQVERQAQLFKKQVQAANDETECQRHKTEDLKAAFNADKRVMQERIEHLEQHVQNNQTQFTELESTIANKNQTDSMQRNELNYWNGKVTNMRRDIEMQQTFNLKVVNENKEHKHDVEKLRRVLELMEAKE